LLRAAAATRAAGEVYNIGSGGGITILDLVNHLNRLLGKNLQAVFAPPRSGDVRHSQADISRARRDLGYVPAVSFAEGLARTLQAHQA
jgi:nucleoside-diphosphate-sugar epimerase